MADRFPLGLFAPSEHQPYLAGAAQIGGVPLAGPPQSADLSTGGWWVYEVSVGRLHTKAQFASWRAFLAQLQSGVGLMEIPVLDILQPWPAGMVGPSGYRVRTPLVPHSDLSPFGDAALYDSEGGAIVATFAAAGYAPSWPAPPIPPTQAQLNIAAGGALQGGEFFTVICPSGAVRMHMIGKIIGVAGSVSTVSFVPPLRENIPAGTAVDFVKPRFLGKADVMSIKDAWPRMTPPFIAAPSIKFVESF